MFKARQRVGFVLDGIPGNYASERITFGAPSGGDDAFSAFMALAEGPLVAGCSVELWLRKVGVPADMTDADYTLAGTDMAPLTAAGGILWEVCGWPGAQIRVKSGSTSGTQYVSAAAS